MGEDAQDRKEGSAANQRTKESPDQNPPDGGDPEADETKERSEDKRRRNPEKKPDDRIFTFHVPVA